MARKSQTQLILSQDTRDAYAALAIIRGEPIAEVTRLALDSYLPVLQARYRRELDRIRGAALAMRVPEGHLVEHMVMMNRMSPGFRMTVDDLYDSQGEARYSLPLADQAYNTRWLTANRSSDE